MSKIEKLLIKILRGVSDANIPFEQQGLFNALIEAGIKKEDIVTSWQQAIAVTKDISEHGMYRNIFSDSY